jgi:ABC-type bacteriocin/lantibiotic exporter with double-glycine peptidase domain
MGGCTVFLVAHRLSTVINADIIAVIHNGLIFEQGIIDIASESSFSSNLKLFMRKK